MARIYVNSIIPKPNLPHQAGDEVASLLHKHAPHPTLPVHLPKLELENDVFGIPRIGLTALDEVHQNLTKIFEKIRSVSKADAEVMARRYKEILKTESDTEYTTKLFGQVKQDFGYGDNKNIFLTTEDKPELTRWGSFDPTTGKLTIRKKLSRLDIFATLFHEFTHVKQYEIAFRTKGAKERHVEMFTKFLQAKRPNLEKTIPGYALELAQKDADDLFVQRRRVFGDLPEFEDGSVYNILGKRYGEADFNYVTADVNYVEYEENILEQEANRNGDLAKEIFRHIAVMK